MTLNKEESKRIDSFVRALDNLDELPGSASYFLKISEKMELPPGLPGPVRGLVILADNVGVNGAYAYAFSKAIHIKDYALATQIVMDRVGCKVIATAASVGTSAAFASSATPSAAAAAAIAPPTMFGTVPLATLGSIFAGVAAYNATEKACGHLIGVTLASPAHREAFNKAIESVASKPEPGNVDHTNNIEQAHFMKNIVPNFMTERYYRPRGF